MATGFQLSQSSYPSEVGHLIVESRIMKSVTTSFCQLSIITSYSSLEELIWYHIMAEHVIRVIPVIQPHIE